METYIKFLNLLATEQREALTEFAGMDQKLRKRVLQDLMVLQNSPAIFSYMLEKNILAVNIKDLLPAFSQFII